MLLADTKPPDQIGRVRDLLPLFFSVLLMGFSTYLLLLIEKLMFARVSEVAMEISVNAAYFSQIFQAPCVALVMMGQVYVGRWIGAGDCKSIGPGIWQLIWFSLLSASIVIPIGWLCSGLYFRETVLGEDCISYSRFLMVINFLYPLGSALACFYLGRGKVLLVLCATIGSQLVKFIAAYVLIFGCKWIPAVGLMGGAISTLIAQGGFCLFLLMSFLSQKNKKAFNSHRWFFQLKLFWACIHPGLLRAMNRILNLTCWALIARLASGKGGAHLLTLSIGGALFVFLPFLADSLSQSQTTAVSQILGARKFSFLNKALRSGAILISIIIIVVSIPLLFFPSITCNLLFPVLDTGSIHIQKVFLGVWLSFVFFTLTALPLSYVLAFKDTGFSLVMGFIAWVNGFLFMYFMIEKVNIAADLFWCALSVMHLSNFILYWVRMRWLQARLISSEPEPSLQT